MRLPLVLPLCLIAAVPALCPAQDAPERTYLTKQEVEQTLIGKPHTFKASNGSLIKWDLRPDGDLYYNNLSYATSGGNGSGKWELRDDGQLCVKWNRAESGNGGCNYYFRKPDGKFGRSGRKAPDAKENAQIESIG
ncbi:hypothetical protein [Variovorax sp.]|uniref:hypothetical protein n=1 Tax=Variovorax sp. TaxID=1871043 RepID=UPI002D6B2126|nr:hypothetical protein [Variovorax sp.]HYP82850.1 hypothetical protein [Variovorax sp.]